MTNIHDRKEAQLKAYKDTILKLADIANLEAVQDNTDMEYYFENKKPKDIFLQGITEGRILQTRDLLYVLPNFEE
jgi:hypothetical protein